MADQSLKGKSIKRCGGSERGRGRGDERTSSRRKEEKREGGKKVY